MKKLILGLLLLCSAAAAHSADLSNVMSSGTVAWFIQLPTGELSDIKELMDQKNDHTLVLARHPTTDVLKLTVIYYIKREDGTAKAYELGEGDRVNSYGRYLAVHISKNPSDASRAGAARGFVSFGDP